MRCPAQSFRFDPIAVAHGDLAKRLEITTGAFRELALCRLVGSHRQGSEIVTRTVSGIHLRRLVQPFADGGPHRR
jgi:hypothetical protein